MKKQLIVTLAFMLVAFAFVSCSSSDEDTKKVDENKKKETAQQAQTPAQPGGLNFDSLAQVVYPVRNENNKFVTIVTDFGNLTLELYHDVAPAHADSFLARSMDDFYKGTIFHRIINRFMIQGGDPTGTGMGNAGYYLNAEFSDLPHQEGTLSMARSSSPNSASSQFFLCIERNRSTQSLDGKYTVFGQLIKGYEVLHKLATVEVTKTAQGEPSKPVDDVYLREAYQSDAEGNRL